MMSGNKAVLYPKYLFPIIFAHRGSSAHAPENTIAAFELAVRQEAEAIELDTKLTKDGEVVVIHDLTVDRTTDGTGRVADLTLSALRELDAGSHFDVAFKGEPIPTLEEVLETIGKRAFTNIELTNYDIPSAPLPEKVAAIVHRFGMTNHTLFSSFHPMILRRIQRLMPKVPVGFLARPGLHGYLARSWLGRWMIPYQALHLELRDLDGRFVQRAHLSGYKVNIYTVNREEEMRRLYSIGVDGIITDDPLLARQVRISYLADPLASKDYQ
jgi:glycerophosphoryl diester phosphodiesterase